MNVQYIQDSNGKDLFVILPIAEFEKLAGRDKYGFEFDDEDENDLESLSDESADNDNALIPHEVVKASFNHEVNLLGAWRIYRGLSQQEAAEKTGLTQSAISQMERKESKPRKATLKKFAQIYDCDVTQMY